jgi:hypothetical protein
VSDYTEPMPTVIRNRDGGFYVRNIVGVDGTDLLDLYDPENPPYAVAERGEGGTLALSRAQAEALVTRLLELLA